jgi:hypothetical protein
VKAPKLTGKIVRDDLALSDAIIAVLSNSKGRRKFTKVILRQQRRLQHAVSPAAWKLYLHIEEAVNDRASYEEDLLVRWAFAEGRRYEGRP